MQSQSARALVALLVCGAACSILTGIPLRAGLALFRTETPTTISHPAAAGLTFGQRVAYQRAIEEVYWRHRIWPKESADPKPSLKEVMSQAQLEKKVADYLRRSQALEDYWQRPLSAEQLQAEMDRMAQHSKQPHILHELFDALGDDPFIVAECLAKPELTEILVGDLSTLDHNRRFESLRNKERPSMSAGATFTSAAYILPEISDADPPCTDDTWTATSTANAPSARDGHTAVWTGSEMIIWGGFGVGTSFNTGGRYRPSTDTWVATSTTNAPPGRGSQTVVWTGSEMIVWGGNDSTNALNTGGRYNPASDSWTATTIVRAPSGRYGHTSVWTGSEMIVWGGRDVFGFFNTGSRYNPGTNSWRAISTSNAPSARAAHTALWTGGEMIVWGGDDGPNNFNTGRRYNPISNTWIATATTNAPDGRYGHAAVWTGNEMIIWGGAGAGDLNTGGRYNPSTNRWTATSLTNAPASGGDPAVWTGSEMIVWGRLYSNAGGRYNPLTNSWLATSTVNAPSARGSYTAVWTGNEIVIWAGFSTGLTRTGGRYCAESLTSQLGNISTRAFVQTGDNVIIGGFIIQGMGPKRVIIRAIGPELGAPPYNIPNPLGNPRLELHNAAGELIGSNDDWQHTIIGGVILRNHVTDIQNSGHAPTNPFESAIIADLPPGNYTAIVSGVNNIIGVGLVEVYDLTANTGSILSNISTRSFVQNGDDVMIGGFIVQGAGTKKVIVRAIGPELGAPPYNIPNALANPTLELHNGTGDLIGSNDNWRTTIIGGIITGNQVSDIINSGHAPGDGRESAIIADLSPGNYTAIVRGIDSMIGVALVEVYDLN